MSAEIKTPVQKYDESAGIRFFVGLRNALLIEAIVALSIGIGCASHSFLIGTTLCGLAIGATARCLKGKS